MRAFLILLSLLGFLSACNTLQGVGEDLKDAGKKLEEATD